MSSLCNIFGGTNDQTDHQHNDKGDYHGSCWDIKRSNFLGAQTFFCKEGYPISFTHHICISDRFFDSVDVLTS